jgi:HEAT repeat protein
MDLMKHAMNLSLAGLLLGASAWAQPQTPVADLAAKLVWAEPAAGRQALTELLRRGAPALRELTALVKAPGQGEDAGARAALHGLALTVNSGADEAARVLFSGVLIEALQPPVDPEVQAFFIAQLQLAGHDEAVAPLAARLTDARLGEPAVRALQQIGTPAALAALRQALPGAQGELTVQLVNALGSARDAESADLILPLATATDSTVRHAALMALADGAALKARDAILAAASSTAAPDRRVGVHAAALLARRLRATGHPDAALDVCLALGATPDGAYAALATLVDLKGAEALPRLIQDAVGPDVGRRESALKLTLELLRQPVTAAWCAKLPEAGPDAREAIVAMLGFRADASAVPALLGALKDSDARVRVAAMEALARFGAATALRPLVEVAASGTDADARAAAAVLGWVGGRDFADVVAAAVPTATPGGKAVLLDLLATRQATAKAGIALTALADADAGVRKAALKALETLAQAAQVPAILDFTTNTKDDGERKAAQRVLGAVCARDAAAATPVVAALRQAEGAARVTLLEAVARVGGAEALALVVADANGTDPARRTAAVKSLADWPDASALDPLLAVAAATPDAKARVLALRGYVRLTGLPADRAPAATVAMLGKAWDIAATADERRLVLSGLGAMRDDAALALIIKALDLEEVREEAAAAAVGVCCPRDDKDPGLLTPVAYAAMLKVRDLAKTTATVEKATRHLESFPYGAGANVALGRPVQTSCPQQGGQAPWKAVDGKVTLEDSWFGDRWPSSITVDLGPELTINAARVVFYWDGTRYYQYKLEASTDGQSWAVLADNSANTRPATETGLVHRFAPVKARLVRLSILKNRVNEAVHLVELEVYSDDPNAPKNTAVQVSDPGDLALGRPVTTSVPQEGDKAPERAVNGILTREDGWWGGATPATFQVDLGAVQSIDTVRAVFYWGDGRYYRYAVEGSADGAAWTVLVDNSTNTTPSTSAGYVHTFKVADVRYVRLNNIRNSANPSCHLAELEVFAAGQAPTTFAMAEPAAPAAPAAPAKPAPVAAPPLPAPDQDGFISLFNGKDLTGWMGSVEGYAAEDGNLVCLENGGGNLLTAQRFSDFVLHFDVRLPKGANNGVAIRAPAEGNPAYVGMELQIIDNDGYKEVHNYELQPWQVHGSIYGCVPAKTGALKPCGEWNHEEVRAVGSRITVILNDQTIVDADVDALTTTADGAGLEKHPGLKRRTGHIGWLGHGAKVEFRNIRIKPLEPYTEGPHNTPPAGFTALFNGKDLTGWKGLVATDNPEKRAALPPEELKKQQDEADADMRANWTVEDGALVFSGKGRSLCTARDYADFEMYVDWKIKDRGDSGIYLRGSPQVQIWDPAQWPQGSGGLYNNQKNPSGPSECADNPIGQWNRFFIRMVGEKVTVVLNGVTVVDNVTLENYWDRAIPIFPSGQIELQNHGNTLWFRNLYIRELPPAK